MITSKFNAISSYPIWHPPKENKQTEKQISLLMEYESRKYGTIYKYLPEAKKKVRNIEKANIKKS